MTSRVGSAMRAASEEAREARGEGFATEAGTDAGASANSVGGANSAGEPRRFDGFLRVKDFSLSNT
ncbi:MAG: hypothetical protein AAF692_01565 [Pseudomonadota bacterium]